MALNCVISAVSRFVISTRFTVILFYLWANFASTAANSSYGTYSVPASSFKTKSDIGLNALFEVAKQFLYCLLYIPLTEYSVVLAP